MSLFSSRSVSMEEGKRALGILLRTWIGEPSRERVLTVGVLIVLFVGVLDVLTGDELSFSIFYVFPISLVVWLSDRRSGFLLSLFCAAIWLAADYLAGARYSNPSFPYWNTMVRVGFFTIIAYLLSALNMRLELEQKMARIDPLTQVVNSRWFERLAQAEIDRAVRYGHPFSVAYIDCDDFKRVNDEFGHRAGDNLLCEVAGTMKENLRRSDTVARLGGDEFVILFVEMGMEGAQGAVQRLQTLLEERMGKGGRPVTFSVGLVTFLHPPPSVDRMISIADEQMYFAKQEGKGRVKWRLWSESGEEGSPKGSSQLHRG